MSTKFSEIFEIPLRNGINRPSRTRGSGYKMINMGEIFANDRLYNIDMELVPLNDTEKNRYEIKKNDLIFARQSIVAEGAGKCSIVMEVDENPVCFESHIIRVRLKENLACPLFYYYLFQSDLGKGFLSSIRQQGVQAGIRGSDLGLLVLPKFPLKTQLKIASILTAYDDLIENNLKRIKLLEEQAQQTYEEWFVRMKFPGYETAVFDEESGLPVGWETKPFSELAQINPKTTIKKGTIAPYVPMSSVSENSMIISPIEERAASGGTKFKNGDTIFARITPCLENGKTGFVQFMDSEDQVSTGSTEYIVFRESEYIGKYFIYCTARTHEFRENAIKSMVGSDGRQRVKVECFEKSLINYPGKKKVKVFEKNFDSVFKLIQNFQKQNQLLKEARDILLPRLMSGMIDVDGLEVGEQLGMVAEENSEYKTNQK